VTDQDFVDGFFKSDVHLSPQFCAAAFDDNETHSFQQPSQTSLKVMGFSIICPIIIKRRA
jgi:hypothetical protein